MFNYIRIYDIPLWVFRGQCKRPPLVPSGGQNQLRERYQNQKVSGQHISSLATGVELESVTWSAEHMGFFTHLPRSELSQPDTGRAGGPRTCHLILTPAPEQPSTPEGCFWSDAKSMSLVENTSWRGLGTREMGGWTELCILKLLLDEPLLLKGGVWKGSWERQDMFLPYFFFLLGKRVKMPFPS